MKSITLLAAILIFSFQTPFAQTQFSQRLNYDLGIGCIPKLLTKPGVRWTAEGSAAYRLQSKEDKLNTFVGVSVGYLPMAVQRYSLLYSSDVVRGSDIYHTMPIGLFFRSIGGRRQIKFINTFMMGYPIILSNDAFTEQDSDGMYNYVERYSVKSKGMASMSTGLQFPYTAKLIQDISLRIGAVNSQTTVNTYLQEKLVEQSQYNFRNLQGVLFLELHTAIHF